MGPAYSGRPIDAWTGRLADLPERRISKSQQSVILLVDDDSQGRKQATRLLERDGYLVLTAADGQEGLEISRQYPGSIDMLIAGVRMPRLNGTDLCAHLFEERPGIKVIFSVSAALSEFFTPFADLPCLTKPINENVLRSKVREILSDPVATLGKPPSDPRNELGALLHRTPD